MEKDENPTLKPDIAKLVKGYFSDLVEVEVPQRIASYHYVDTKNKKNYPFQTFSARFEFSPKKLENLRVHVRDWAERIRFEVLSQGVNKVIWRTPPVCGGNDMRQKYVRYMDVFMRCAFIKPDLNQVKATFSVKADGYPILYYPGVNPPLIGKNMMRESPLVQKK